MDLNKLIANSYGARFLHPHATPHTWISLYSLIIIIIIIIILFYYFIFFYFFF